MQTASDIPPTMQPVDPPGIRPRRQTLWYAIGLAAAPVLALLAICWIASTEWFLNHDAYPGARVMGYGERLSGADCDILVYGDSTALTEIDPAILTARTGLPACNISEGAPVHLINGSNFVLDNYLKHNKRPKYLLSFWSATLFRPELTAGSGYAPEGVIYALHYDRRDFLRFVTYPTHLISFAKWAVTRLVIDLKERLTGTHAASAFDERVTRAQRRGVWTYRAPPETACTRGPLPQPYDVAENRRSVKAFRDRYSVGGTRVLVDVSAVANCDPNVRNYAAATGGVSDNKLEVLPIRAFNQGDVHISPEGANYMTDKGADQILAFMRSSARHP